MKERLSIVLTDVNGSKHYNIHTVIKNIIFYIILLFISILIIGLFFISYLSNSVDELRTKKLNLDKTYIKLKEDNIKVLETISNKEEELEQLFIKGSLSNYYERILSQILMIFDRPGSEGGLFLFLGKK